MSVIGLAAKVYRNTATYASPTWSEMTNVKDVTQGIETAKWDASRRASIWRQFITTLLEASAEITMIYVSGDANYEALRDAITGQTTVDVALMSGNIATSGSEGLRAVWYVEGFSRDEPLEEGLMVTITLTPAYEATNAPTWMEVA